MASSVRDLIASIIPDEHAAIVDLYNRQPFAEPQITLDKLEAFLAQLLAIETRDCEDDIVVVIQPDGDELDIAGEGWGFYDDITWSFMTRWDVEWRPAAEVLGLTLDDRSGASRLLVIVWMLEELGVYLASPRT